MLDEEKLSFIFSVDEQEKFINFSNEDYNEMNFSLQNDENEENFKDKQLYFLPKIKKDSEIENNEYNKKSFEITNKTELLIYKKCDEKIKTKDENKLGKKKGRQNSILSQQTKFLAGNLIRKCKYILIKELLDFINYKIEEKYNKNIGKGIFIKKLLTMNQRQK